MNGGELGKKTSRGKYEGNDVPGARDPDEAYDRAVYQFDCALGERKSEGPQGFVSYFEVDFGAPPELDTEDGTPQVVHMGSETCIIIPRFQVQKIHGTQIIYRWYDCWCEKLGIEGDAWIELEEVSRQRHTKIERYPLEPRIRCDTDWVKWFLEQLGRLAEAGLSGAKLAAAVRTLGKDGVLPARVAQGLAIAAGMDVEVGADRPQKRPRGADGIKPAPLRKRTASRGRRGRSKAD